MWAVFRLKKRPIIAKFFNDKELEAILSKGSKLRHTGFSISRGYSQAIHDKRCQLLQFSRLIKKQGDRMRLTFDKLRINNDTYVWDVTGSRAVPVHHPTTV